MKTVLITVLIAAIHVTTIKTSSVDDGSETSSETEKLQKIHYAVFSNAKEGLKIYAKVNIFTGYRIIEESKPVVTYQQNISISDMNKKGKERCNWNRNIEIYEYTESNGLKENFYKTLPKLLFLINEIDNFEFTANQDNDNFELKFSASDIQSLYSKEYLIKNTDLEIGIGGFPENSFVSCRLEQGAEHLHIVIEDYNCNSEVLIRTVLSWKEFLVDPKFANLILCHGQSTDNSILAFFKKNLLLPELLINTKSKNDSTLANFDKIVRKSKAKDNTAELWALEEEERRIKDSELE